uniref:Predicted gene 11111 n=1 Tax=Mus spicilegus TaxID=10103 RepID=A0A8C6GDC4_MUSSI
FLFMRLRTLKREHQFLCILKSMIAGKKIPESF